MQKNRCWLVFTTICLAQMAHAQNYQELLSLKGEGARVYYSAGRETRSAAITQRVNKATAYFTGMLAFKPEVTLLVLNPEDWGKYTTMGAVYGLPHYDDANNTLVVASDDNPFWKSFLPPLEQLPPPMRHQVQEVYLNTKGDISMQAFFDLLAIHELGHAFHKQRDVNMQRPWMGELFVNILLHTYIAENEPGQLPALTTFPRMVTGAGSKDYKYTSLKDIEQRYEEIARNYPKNYGWFQSCWHSAAATIYNTYGKQACSQLWNALLNQKEGLTDEQLVNFLSATANNGVADMITNWSQYQTNL